MKFNQLYASFPKLLETFSSPFSSRKRKREQADALDDSLSARPAKQAPVAQFSSHPAPVVSHQSNTRGPVTAARTQVSLPQPADQYREATSQSAQIIANTNTASGSSLPALHPDRPAAKAPQVLQALQYYLTQATRPESHSAGLSSVQGVYA